MLTNGRVRIRFGVVSFARSWWLRSARTGQLSVLPVARFSRGIGIVLIKRCGKNLAVAGCGFLCYFCHAIPLFWAGFWSDKCKSVSQRCVIWRLLLSLAYFCNRNSLKIGLTGIISHYLPNTRLI